MSTVKRARQVVSSLALALAAVDSPSHAVGFYGNAVSANYEWPNRGTVLYASGTVAAGPVVEFPAVGGLGVSVDFTDTSVRIAYANGWTFNTSAPKTFDGLTITVSGAAPTISGVSLAGTNIPGYGASNLSFDATHVYVNHAGLSSLAPGSFIDVAVYAPAAVTQISFSVTTVSFCSAAAGTVSQPRAVTVFNSGTGNLLLGPLALAGFQGEFALLPQSCDNALLPPNASCSFSVQFRPTGFGLRTASVEVPSNANGAPHAIALKGTGIDAQALQGVAGAVEYCHAAFDHYFVTTIADEIAKLDTGVFAGWSRTGQSFRVLSTKAGGTSNVCRFFSTSFAPKSSHFYTPSAAECETVKRSHDWQFEGDVFAIESTDAAGDCPPGTIPLYRLYNDGQGAAPNHRYTTSPVTRSEMISQGWIPEGAGIGVIGCVPL